MSKLYGRVCTDKVVERAARGDNHLEVTVLYNWDGKNVPLGEAVKVYVEHKRTEIYVRVFVFGELQYENAIQKEK